MKRISKCQQVPEDVSIKGMLEVQRGRKESCRQCAVQTKRQTVQRILYWTWLMKHRSRFSISVTSLLGPEKKWVNVGYPGENEISTQYWKLSHQVQSLGPGFCHNNRHRVTLFVTWKTSLILSVYCKSIAKRTSTEYIYILKSDIRWPKTRHRINP